MHGDTVGNTAWSATLNLAGGTQVGDVGDAESAQFRAAVVLQAAQFTGPEEPPGPHTRGVGDVAKVPGAVQRWHAYVTAAAKALFSRPISARAMDRM
jgi:hypothetical protein